MYKLSVQEEEKIDPKVWYVEGEAGRLDIERICVEIGRPEDPIRVKQYTGQKISHRHGGEKGIETNQEAKTVALMTVNTPEIKGTEVPDDPPQPSQEEIECYEKIGGKLKEDTAIRMAEKGWTHASRVKKVKHQEEAPEWKVTSSPGTAHEALQERYRLGSLLGRGGFGSVFAATRLSDGAPVAIKRVPRNRVRHWGELPDGSRAPLEIVLQAKVSTGFPGVVQLLEWFELPNHIVMVLERPERCQDLHRVIRARRFVPEEVARELFRQVLEAVWHCTSCGVLHRDIKPENIVLDLATGQAKLIDFGCGTYLQETVYTHFAGTPSYSPPEWTHFGWYHGEAATIWSLGILLHQMVCGEHPFRRGRNLSWGQLPLPQGLSQGHSAEVEWGFDGGSGGGGE
ncbi:serine/threonine-protein kinase pim-1-like [Agelaius phoeniceus]|uniref:serine/threonine-protein kinase pim-1-like n=1 Tax=Agelaius phoeniceus TaxID=39638 RepID=UPI004054A668